MHRRCARGLSNARPRLLQLQRPQRPDACIDVSRGFAAPTQAAAAARAAAAAAAVRTRGTRPGPQRAAPTASGAGPASAFKAGVVRWPFLRNKALISEITQFINHAEGFSAPSQLWVTGARGSGASTTIQAAIGSTEAAISGAGARGASVVLFTCPGGPGSGGQDAAATDAQLLGDFCKEFRQQLASTGFGDSEASIGAMVRTVLGLYPEAAAHILATLEALGSRSGLPGVLPSGTVPPKVRECLNKHRDDPVRLVADVSQLLATGSQRLLQVDPPSALHVALGIIAEAGSRQLATTGVKEARVSVRPAEYLLAAAEGLAAASSRDVVLVLLGAELLTRAARMAPRPPRVALLMAIEQRLAASKESTAGRVRLLLHARDAFAAVRARAAGTRVVTADAWSEQMAKAVFVPRFLEDQDETAWQGIWSSVGGHPAHLRMVAELLVEERRILDKEKQQEEMAQQRAEMLKQLRPGMSVDAEEKRKIAEQEHKDDSLRADARKPLEAPESLLRRLPEVLGSEIASFEGQMKVVVGHRLLEELRQNFQSRPGETAADLLAALRALCAAESIPAEPTADGAAGSGATGFPLVLALMDAGLLVPKWSGAAEPGLVVANQLTRDMLLAWAEALCADLPWREAATATARTWRLSG